MQRQTTTPVSKIGLNVILWVLVALYTFMLPDAIIVYRDIVGAFGQAAAGKVPLIIVVIVGIAYAFAVVLSQKSLKNLLFLVPSAIIAFLIMRLVDNPNKHIHIPEYVLMAWLLFAVLSKDYKGKGLFILIFVYATLLGVVDELEQGINPARFYGLPDMIVNSASALIGVFTIMGLKNIIATDWAWASHLKKYKAFIGLGAFGFIGAVIMCAYLFRVQASGKFWGVYPEWLLIWNILYLLLAPAIAVYRSILHKNRQVAEDRKDSLIPLDARTARLWIFPLLVILFYMQSLLIYIAISGVKFD